jgi:hypothetical protein
MQEPMNRRRFLALSASVTPLTEVGGALENFTPHLSELAFATPIPPDWYDMPDYDSSLAETLLLSAHVLEPT